MNAWRDVVPSIDNVPATIAPGRVPSKGKSAGLGVVPFKQQCAMDRHDAEAVEKKEKSVCPGIVGFNDNVKGTKELLREAKREGRLAHYNQWDRSSSPKKCLSFL